MSYDSYHYHIIFMPIISREENNTTPQTPPPCSSDEGSKTHLAPRSVALIDIDDGLINYLIDSRAMAPYSRSSLIANV